MRRYISEVVLLVLFFMAGFYFGTVAMDDYTKPEIRPSSDASDFIQDPDLPPGYSVVCSPEGDWYAWKTEHGTLFAHDDHNRRITTRQQAVAEAWELYEYKKRSKVKGTAAYQRMNEAKAVQWEVCK